MGELPHYALRVVWWAIDGPAWLIGGMIGAFFPICVLLAAGTVTERLYRSAETRAGRVLAIIVGIYLATVLYDAGHHLAVTILHPPYESGS